MEFHLLPRVYMPCKLEVGIAAPVEAKQVHYIANVMRLSFGDKVRLFNGRNGEWLGSITKITKRSVDITPHQQLRPQTPEPELALYCAPIKKAHFDYMIEKATELGVALIQPILTSRTQIREVNVERCQSLAIESAEQSERLNIPSIKRAILLQNAIENWPADFIPIVCAEWGEALPIQQAFTALKPLQKSAIIVGPEGGFTAEDLALLKKLPSAYFVRLGPRILRADTAAIAALSCWQALCGDWKSSHQTNPREV